LHRDLSTTHTPVVAIIVEHVLKSETALISRPILIQPFCTIYKLQK